MSSDPDTIDIESMTPCLRLVYRQGLDKVSKIYAPVRALSFLE